ncbi:protein transport protein sec24-like cef [Phtheirospermum japonicum]|uniref:Protein transport protein sec24-like cef n=1 Tax=Phtheirospermum japonicum TaxID=374723 RepID=A0A830CRS1_9LAMI|nr:protein transport protein sec24-like cef [Phtheirospermum japonicum]
MTTPGGPRSGNFPPNGNPNALANNMQNLQINQPNQQQSSNTGGSSAPRPSNTSPFRQAPPPFTGNQPRPPPQGAFPRGPPPSSAPSQNALPPNMASPRPTGPAPVSQPPPFASRPPQPGPFPPSIGGPAAPSCLGPVSSSPPISGLPQVSAHDSVGNGPPSGPRFPPAMASMLRPSVGPPQPPTMLSSGTSSQPPQMRTSFGSLPAGAPSSMGQQAPPFSGPAQNRPPLPGSSLFLAPVPGMPQSSGSVYGMQTWPPQPQQVAPAPPMSGSMQQQQILGMPSSPSPFPNQSMTLSQSGGSKIDSDLIPRLSPSSAVILHETRQNNQANPPPPATSDYIVKDTGNCSPRYIRCTINQIPCTVDLLSTSAMQFALLVQPLALPHPSEEPIQVVDFGESGPVRCSRCKGYINPFMKFIDQGRRFICNLCGFTDETPRDYHCNLGPDGRRRDADERPELCRGTVEFIASTEYMVRDPMPAVFFFLIDVSMNAIQTGATAAACSAINQVISDLPEGPRTMVGIATFDSTIHFYNLKRALQQPLMLIVPDIQDVYTPLASDVIVQLAECRQHLEILLESIPTMFQNNRTADSAFGAATMAAFLAMKNTGGKLLVFQSVLPSTGIGSLAAREAEGRSNASAGEKCNLFFDTVAALSQAIDSFLTKQPTTTALSQAIDSFLTKQHGRNIEDFIDDFQTMLAHADKESHKLLQPVDKTLKTMAIDFAEYQVCVDLFITTQSYVDIASLSLIPRTTGGQVYHYSPFSAFSDPAKLYNDLRWNVTRPQAFEAVMRVRCSQGIQVQDYSGNFCKRIPTDVDLPAVCLFVSLPPYIHIDCDKTIMVSLKHDDKLQEGSECSFQCALLYTTIYGQRRIRVSTLSLPCTNILNNIFRFADLDTQFACLLKKATNEIPSTPLSQVRDQITNDCINILSSYRKFCATVSSSGQLILPEALKLLPLYTLALLKSNGLRTDGRTDDRSFWINYVSSLRTPLVIPLVYPRMIAIHDLDNDEKEFDDSGVPIPIPLSSEHVSDEGIYLVENGEDCLIYVGNSVHKNVLQQLFDFSSVEEISNQQYDNPLSKKLNDVVNEIRRQRCSYLRLKLCKKGDSSGMMFFSYMVEDRTSSGLSYVEYLVHIHRQIQSKPA